MLNPAPQHSVLFTVDDFEKMIDAGVFAGRTGRIELIEGELRKMSPASEIHDSLIRALTMWSVRQQTEELFEIAVQMGMQLKLTESMPEPDLFWLRTGHRGRPIAESVPLVIEVSAATLRYDRVRKGRLYALDRIQEYWLVDLENQQIEVRTEPEGEEYQQLRICARGGALHPQCLPSAKLDVDWLFRSVET